MPPVIGVDATRVFINNPWTGQEWINKALFERVYATYNQMAVVLA